MIAEEEKSIVERLSDRSDIFNGANSGAGFYTPSDAELDLAVIATIQRLERELADKSAWQLIDSAPKDIDICALSPEHIGPVMLRWYKYNGLEAWRDWDADPHNPTHWFPLPPTGARTLLSPSLNESKTNGDSK